MRHKGVFSEQHGRLKKDGGKEFIRSYSESSEPQRGRGGLLHSPSHHQPCLPTKSLFGKASCGRINENLGLQRHLLVTRQQRLGSPNWVSWFRRPPILALNCGQLVLSGHGERHAEE